MEVPGHIKCDVCKQPKGETNHWLVAITKPGLEGILFLPAEAVETPRNPSFTYEDLCGQACSLKRHSRWLDDLHDTSPTTSESVNA